MSCFGRYILTCDCVIEVIRINLITNRMSDISYLRETEQMKTILPIIQINTEENAI